MTPAVRAAALADLRDARDAERGGDWRGAHYMRQMTAMMLHFEGETFRAVQVHRGSRGRWVYARNLLSFAVGGFGVEADADAVLRRYRGLIAQRAARVGGWADPDSLD